MVGRSTFLTPSLGGRLFEGREVRCKLVSFGDDEEWDGGLVPVWIG